MSHVPRVHCPYCQTVNLPPPRWAGGLLRCGGCQWVMTVPVPANGFLEWGCQHAQSGRGHRLLTLLALLLFLIFFGRPLVFLLMLLYAMLFGG